MDDQVVPASVTAPSLPLSVGRLRLRHLQRGDRDELVRMHRDPRVRELLVDDAAFDDSRLVAAFLQRIEAFYTNHPGLGIWAAEHWYSTLTPSHPDYLEAEQALSPQALARALLPRAHFIGWFNLMPMTDQPEEVELGCRLVPAVWGSGLAIEGGTQVLDHAFGVLGRDRVWAACHPAHRSVHLRLRMLGFEYHCERPYEGVPASHFVVDRLRWDEQRARPLAVRQREGLAWVKQHAGRSPC